MWLLTCRVCRAYVGAAADKLTWQHLQTSGPFQGRFDHTATRIGRRIFVVGGVTTTSADYIGQAPRAGLT